MSSLLIFQGVLHRFANLGIQDDLIIDSGKTRAVALACKMVGGGSDGSLDLCARVCIIDEYENILFHSISSHNFLLQTTGAFLILWYIFLQFKSTYTRVQILFDLMLKVSSSYACIFICI